MSETTTSAMLVGSPDMFAARSNALTATIPRDQIAEALQSDPPAELILDVVRGADREDAERRSVSITWTQRDLESLLELPGPDAVQFYFDPEELGRLFDDVEAHGLREAAVVLSIAAAAAVGAGQAAASPDMGGASITPIAAAAHDEAGLAERGISPGTLAAVHDEAGLTARGISPGTPGATHDEVGLTERGISPGTLAAVHDEAGTTARGIEPGALPAIHDEAGITERGIEPGTLPAVHDEAGMTARGIDPGYVPAVHDEATLVTRGIVPDPGPVSVADTGSGFDFPSIEPATAAAVAGAAAGAGLLLVGAAFATRRRELGTP
jgi:hypothetical protein